jgi:hypothetical protein
LLFQSIGAAQRISTLNSPESGVVFLKLGILHVQPPTVQLIYDQGATFQSLIAFHNYISSLMHLIPPQNSNDELGFGLHDIYSLSHSLVSISQRQLQSTHENFFHLPCQDGDMYNGLSTKEIVYIRNNAFILQQYNVDFLINVSLHQLRSTFQHETFPSNDILLILHDILTRLHLAETFMINNNNELLFQLSNLFLQENILRQPIHEITAQLHFNSYYYFKQMTGNITSFWSKFSTNYCKGKLILKFSLPSHNVSKFDYFPLYMPIPVPLNISNFYYEIVDQNRAIDSSEVIVYQNPYTLYNAHLKEFNTFSLDDNSFYTNSTLQQRSLSCGDAIFLEHIEYSELYCKIQIRNASLFNRLIYFNYTRLLIFTTTSVRTIYVHCNNRSSDITVTSSGFTTLSYNCSLSHLQPHFHIQLLLNQPFTFKNILFVKSPLRYYFTEHFIKTQVSQHLYLFYLTQRFNFKSNYSTILNDIFAFIERYRLLALRTGVIFLLIIVTILSIKIFLLKPAIEFHSPMSYFRTYQRYSFASSSSLDLAFLPIQTPDAHPLSPSLTPVETSHLLESFSLSNISQRPDFASVTSPSRKFFLLPSILPPIPEENESEF